MLDAATGAWLARIPASERIAAHAYTDNVLIATTACVFFAFATAVFARGAHEHAALPRRDRLDTRLLDAGEVA